MPDDVLATVDIIELHHIFSDTDLSVLRAGTPGQYRLVFDGRVAIEKSAGVSAQVTPRASIVNGAVGFSIDCPGEWTVYSAPEETARRQIVRNRRMTVIEVRDGWWCVYRKDGRELWLKKPICE